MGRRTIWLPEDLERDLDVAAEAWGVTFSQLVASLAAASLHALGPNGIRPPKGD